jgi:hypothetical protein
VYEATLNDAASRTLDRVVQPQPATIAKQTLQESGTGEKLTALPSHDTRNSLQRVARLRPMLDPILSQTGVPVELSAIVVVESGGDAVKSTRAAAEYLRDLFAEFHDWQLALAAYNAGEQSVQQAMARTGGAVFSIVARALPAETQNYVPAVFNVLPRFGDSNPKQFTSRARLQQAVYASVGQ